jgi:outer membrane protein OmpA-like peptidoglycan-associated protein
MTLHQNTNSPHKYRARVITGALPFVLCLAVGCPSTAPKELHDARNAYRQAAAGPAQRYTPAQLHTAEEELKLAESSFEDEGDSARTRDRAYIAQRKAQLAEVQGRTAEANESMKELQKGAEQAQVAELQQMRGALGSAQERQKSAEARAATANAELARLASVKQEDRGMVITLSGSVLFASDKTELLPAAQQKLTEVAKALNEGDDASQMVVEGHTDAKGSATHNQELSTQRAESVRRYLVSQGIAESRIRSMGLGFSRPVADNKSAEGRANNRRVEIVVQPSPIGTKPSASM